MQPDFLGFSIRLPFYSDIISVRRGESSKFDPMAAEILQTASTSTKRAIATLSESAQAMFEGKTVLRSVNRKAAPEIDKKELAGLNLSIYPNPSEGVTQLEIKNLLGPTPCTVDIFDQVGELVFSTEVVCTNAQRNNLDLSHLNPGLYFCIVVSADKRGSTKVVIR